MYDKQTWLDTTGSKLNRYKDQNNQAYEFTWWPDASTVEGTPFTAARMNHIEEELWKVSVNSDTVIEWNQLALDGSFTSLDNSTSNLAGRTISDNVLTLTANADGNSFALRVFAGTNRSTGLYRTIIGHKYYFSIEVNPELTGTLQVSPYNVATNNTHWGNKQFSVTANKWQRISFCETNNIADDVCFWVYPMRNTTAVNGKKCDFRNYMLVDLTQMFGVGKEPTVQEFEAIFTDAWYEYSSGTKVGPVASTLAHIVPVAEGAMPKSGGTFTGVATATSMNRPAANLRNISVYSNGGGLEVSTNSIVMHRK